MELMEARRPRGGHCLGESPSSGEGLSEDNVADVSEIANHMELKCFPSRGGGTRSGASM